MSKRLADMWFLEGVMPVYVEGHIVSYKATVYCGDKVERFKEDTCAKAHDVAARFCELKNAEAEQRAPKETRDEAMARMRKHYGNDDSFYTTEKGWIIVCAFMAGAGFQ